MTLALGLGLLLAVAGASLAVWAARRHSSSRTSPVILVQGTTWFIEEGQLVGPCCDACKVQAMARPLQSSPEGAAHYELCCPRCGKVPVRRAFTLLELLELEQEATRAWERQRSRANLPFPSPRRH